MWSVRPPISPTVLTHDIYHVICCWFWRCICADKLQSCIGGCGVCNAVLCCSDCIEHVVCVCIFSLGTPIVLSLSGLGPRQSTSHLAIGDKVGHKQRMDRTIRHFLFSMVLLSIRCMSVCNCKGQHCYVMKNACSMPSFVQPAKWS